MINTLEELERLLKMLRANGVGAFKFQGMELALNDAFIMHQNVPMPTVEGNPELPSEAEMDAAVGMPVGGLEDPFLNYSAPVVPPEEPEVTNGAENSG